jgi:hypothetical protein
MADRPRATAPAGSRRAPAPDAAARHSTARVATTAGVRKSELPGWFWGALGCMTVLVVGLAIVFIMGQSSRPAPGSSAPAGAPAQATAAVSEPPAAAGTPGVQRARGPGIQIEPMAPGAAPAARAPAATPPAARAKPAARPFKMARSPSGSPRPTVAAKPEAGGAAPSASDSDSDEEELLKPKPRAAAPADDEKSDDGN